MIQLDFLYWSRGSVEAITSIFVVVVVTAAVVIISRIDGCFFGLGFFLTHSIWARKDPRNSAKTTDLTKTTTAF